MAEGYADNFVTEAYANCLECPFEAWPEKSFRVNARRLARKHNRETGHEVHYHFSGFSVYPGQESED